MRTSLAILLSLPFVASAYQVLVPNSDPSGEWNTSGSQPLAWSRVDTDPLNFTVILVNQASNPQVDQVLAALVDGTLLSTIVNPPSEGWPSGNGFQVNLVSSTSNSTILAQSTKFTINQTNVTTTSTTQGTEVPNTVAMTGSINPTGDSNAPPSPNAAPRMPVMPGFVGALAILFAFLI
jgi:hypothetical protein